MSNLLVKLLHIFVLFIVLLAMVMSKPTDPPSQVSLNNPTDQPHSRIVRQIPDPDAAASGAAGVMGAAADGASGIAQAAADGIKVGMDAISKGFQAAAEGLARAMG